MLNLFIQKLALSIQSRSYFSALLVNDLKGKESTCQISWCPKLAFANRHGDLLNQPSGLVGGYICFVVVL